MDEHALPVIGGERCEYLRWKGLYIDEAENEEASGAEHIYWCLKTQIGLGPDGKLAGKSECNPRRACYKAL